MSHVLAIDQGTTSSRALLFDGALGLVAAAQEEFPQSYPRPGWVEHDPEAIWRSVVKTAKDALAKAGVAARDLAGLGIANQRETTLVWERETGRPIHPAIVWQDRRTAPACRSLQDDGAEPLVQAKTGLLLDPYFSATKLAWLLDAVDGARAAAEAGRLAFGTIDSYLVWRLTGGAVHATDATNASRTLLYDIHTGGWDTELLRLFRIPESLLPEVKDCAAEFGATAPDILGAAVPIRGVAGDQQAATVGQACFRPGMIKSTYGTGCFALLNTGKTAVASQNRLLTTVAYSLGGETTYALEGAIFVAGAVVQWLRDGLRLIGAAAETQPLAEAADPAQAVYLVPAFTGLGAPYWDPDCRGAIFGLARNTGPAELARAALESVAYQTRDLVEAMQRDWAAEAAADATPTVLRVDGGMTASDWTMQFLADMLAAPVDRPRIQETTALGAAALAALQAGLIPSLGALAEAWTLDRRFEPAIDAAVRDAKYAGWRDAVRRTLTRG